MNKIKKITVIYIFVLILLLSGCGNGKQIVLTTGFRENELFRIDSDSCYAGETLIYLVNTKNQYKNLYGEQFLSVSTDGVEVEDTVNQAVFSELTRVKVMNLLATNYQISLDDSDLELINKAANDYYGSLTQEEKELFNVNSNSDIEQLYKEYRIAEKVYEFIVKDIEPEISDDEARTMVVKEIFFSTVGVDDKTVAKKQREADEVLKLLLDGEDFDSVAASYSDDDQTNKSYTKISIDSQIKDRAFNLSKDELSDVLEGSDGYYILYCVDPFSRDETDSTKEIIVNARKLEAFENVYNKFVADRRFFVNEDLLGQVTNIDISNIKTNSFFDSYYNYFK